MAGPDVYEPPGGGTGAPHGGGRLERLPERWNATPQNRGEAQDRVWSTSRVLQQERHPLPNQPSLHNSHRHLTSQPSKPRGGLAGFPPIRTGASPNAFLVKIGILPIKISLRPSIEPDETGPGRSVIQIDKDSRSTAMSVMQNRFYDRTDLMRTTDAKKEYFLDSKDFDSIPCIREKGFFGCGGSTFWFRKDDLEKAALSKHGEDVLKKKREARAKRNESKRRRSEEARQALAELHANKKPAKIDGVEVCVIDATQEEQMEQKDIKDAKLLKKNLLSMCKRALKMYPNGHPMPISLEIPNVSAGVFAALLDRAGDHELKTFEKQGAYIKHYDSAPSFFSSTQEKLTRSYHMDRVAVTMCDRILLMYKPSLKVLTLKGHGEITNIPGDNW